MDLLGKNYIVEHAVSELNQKAKRESYDRYVAEALRSVVFNAARQDKVMTIKSFDELMAPPPKDESKKAEDIINRIKNKLKGG